jgi:hypothetical protein
MVPPLGSDCVPQGVPFGASKQVAQVLFAQAGVGLAHSVLLQQLPVTQAPPQQRLPSPAVAHSPLLLQAVQTLVTHSGVVLPAGQPPQSSVPSQPSLIVPQFLPWAAHVVLVQHWSSSLQTSLALGQHPLTEQITSDGQTQSPP